jgi:hypothetical protein
VLFIRRRHGVSQASFFRWFKHFRVMSLSEASG